MSVWTDRRSHTLLVFLLFLFAFAGAAATPGAAGAHGVDVRELTAETQRQSSRPKKMTLVWWIPDEFWQAAMSENPEITPERLSGFLEVVHPYIIVAAVDGSVGPMAGVNYKPADDLRQEIRLVVAGENLIPPLPDEEVAPDTRNLISMLKPVLANMLGAMGENLHFFLFPAQDGDGHRRVDATREGAFTVRLGDEDFRWRLPLASLAVPKICPVDGERLNGAWKYCPWHGKALREEKFSHQP